MPEPLIYLDYAAGTPPSREVIAAGLQVAAKLYGNPSAIHAAGTAAAEHLETARRDIAKVLAVKAANLIFTAGATEANNLIALSLRQTYPQAMVATLAIDHDSQRLNADCLLQVNPKSGQVDPGEILNLPDSVCCLSLAGINNELGVIQPFAAIKQVLEEKRRRRAVAGHELPLLLHVDASQMALTHTVQPQALAAAELVTLNGAKFYAFKQSGLLYLKAGLGLKPPLKGGGQENGWRPGGESLLLATGLRLALLEAERCREEEARRLKDLQADFEAGLRQLGGEVVLGRAAARSPHLSAVIFAGRDNETLALQLSRHGICVGIGSACHSRSDLFETSALRAIGYGREEVYGALRFSFGYETDRTQLAHTLEVLGGLLKETG